jgi:PPK2 family polyphosphate:nucleotide phosphotransferase
MANPSSPPTRDPLRNRLIVKPGGRVTLAKFNADETFGWTKETAAAQQQQYEEGLTDLQARLWAESKRSLLVVLQGIDCAGKDGTIRHVMDAFNPQGCRVSGFKQPSTEELAHDFLWRIHARTPGRGEVGIFNRSHYEDVLVVRVHKLVSRSVTQLRYREINDWERMLSENGTTIVKLFLYIDKDEQRERLQARLDDPTKRWKFSEADLTERQLWDEYIRAYEDALSRCSTDWAPWYLIPANRKWFRNLAVAHILGDTLQELNPRYPKAAPGIEDTVIP